MPEKISSRFVLAAILVALIAGFLTFGCAEPEADIPAEQAEEIEEPAQESESEAADDLPVTPVEAEEEEESAEEENAASESETSNQPPSSDSSSSQNQTPLLVVLEGDYLLALVIKDTTLKSDFVPANLVPVPAYMHPSYSMQLRNEALEYLEQLWQAAEADGVTLHIRSAYRSYNTQKKLFNDYASKYGEEQANRFSARPGQSEHQLGTAIDFGGTNVDFKADYGQTPQGLWLAANAYKYGFAMSYAEGKEHITGYIYEPWHYRYIGVEAAGEWKGSGKTLKEFLEGKPQYYE
ncbi:MAG: M15 family metallopeptidase [Dethiobacteria bacterium]|nr:M15 family metallopeptidase [Dethiobacteria bacterium]